MASCSTVCTGIKIVGVIDSDDFLFWNGAHWEKAKEKQEFRAIEDVVRLYERLAAEKEKESDSVDKRDDPDLKKELQKQLGANQAADQDTA